MASNNHNNSNKHRGKDKDFHGIDESAPMYGQELMDAEDSLLEVRSSFNKMEKNEVLVEKLVDKDFYRDFGDIFDPDLK